MAGRLLNKLVALLEDPVHELRIEPEGGYETAPYVMLGPASYVRYMGERPIAITWGLQHAMPSTFFESATLAAS